MDDHSLPAGEFKATCLKLMDEVAASGREVTITKRGKPVAKLVPIQPPARRGSAFGALAHLMTVVEGDDSMSYPVDRQVNATIREWDEIEAEAATREKLRGTGAASGSRV